ncbi:hypothetical protein D779_0224 [Imhoffiella purpurea]|uniref:Putative restriction endonuclease domain-containing protein n=2 Tax=Imhoffiella purpurea TaxID=1249627 RepID=W9V520_9GAMM|nr:hypothetical protein D779_0224 [Imhoffiella purpurea]
MIDAGVFADGDRVELIDGEMRDMSPIGPLHNSATNTLNMILAPLLSGKAIVSVQGPLVLDDGTEVYPDLMVLRQRADRYAESNPTGEDVLLVVEVADSSLAADTGVKLAKYAHVGIRLYWVVDIPSRALHAYRDPNAFAGRYRQLHSVGEGALGISIQGVDVRVEVADLFPR